MIARTVLYLPASRASAVTKARGLDVDVVVLDLEDAVGPDDKAAARQAAAAAIAEGGFRAPVVGVRLNGGDTPWGSDDLEVLSQLSPALIVVPKIDRPETLSPLLDALPQAAVWAMIETPAALFRLDAIAAVLAGRPGSGLMLGANDLATALDCEPGADRAPLHWAMSAVVAAARAHGLIAVDAVFNRLDDDAAFRVECEQGRRWGFDGKSLIHPRHVAIAADAFSPSPQQVAEARAVVAAYAEPGAQGAGALRLDGRMVEPLHLEHAHRVLALHAKTESA